MPAAGPGSPPYNPTAGRWRSLRRGRERSTADVGEVVTNDRENGVPWREVVVVTLAAAGARIAFAAATALPSADPWRHLSLVRNLRAGLGFTLFDGQPYFWYPSPWYRVAALAPPAEMKWVAAAFSTLAAPLFALFVARALRCRRAGLAGGLAFALCGPLVQHAGQLGAEGFALFLLCGALAVSTVPRPAVAGGASGVLFGLAVVSRLQLGVFGLLFVPMLKRARSGVLFVALALLAPAWVWIHNHEILSTHPIVFTWDGLATPASSYGPVTTLAPQLHRSVVESNARLYEAAFEHGPEWLFTGSGRLRLELLALVALGLAGLVAGRCGFAGLAALVTMLAMGPLDATHSGWFERNWFGLLPLLCLGVGAFAARWAHRGWRTGGGALAAGLLVLFVALGAPSFRQPEIWPIEAVTPPPDLLQERCYFVGGGFYHPQGVLWRYPDKRILGLPRDAAMLDELLERYPDCRAMLWHPFAAETVQRELFEFVRASPRFRAVANTVNEANYAYLVVEVP